MAGATAGRYDPGEIEPSLATPPPVTPPLATSASAALPVATPPPLAALASSVLSLPTPTLAAPVREAKMIEQLANIEFTNWPLSASKRVFDVIVASSLLVLVSPLMMFIAVVIRLTSRGPVFFCAPRVGRFGETFPMLKFRSMVNNCEGPKLTSKNDGRVTFIGRILRKFKLDELPQLINVISGHMSMVGPRPHLPEVFSFEPEYNAFLHLWPGVTGAASVRFRKEEFPGIPWTELRTFYLSSVLPQKVQIELEYATHATFWSDLRLILQTAHCAFWPAAKHGAALAQSPTVPELPRRLASETQRSLDTKDWAA